MDSKGPAQASESTLNMSEFVNFDLGDVDTLNTTAASRARSLVAEPFLNMCVNDSFVNMDDAVEADFTGTFEPSVGSNALGFGFDATEVASVESEVFDADFITLSPASEASDLTDTFQNATETDAMPDDLNMFEPMAFVHPAVLEIPRSPSRWVPVSSQLRQQLNAVYASQLARLAADPHAPPVLYLPSEGPSASPMPSTWSMSSEELPRTDLPYIPQLNAKPLSVDPSLLMRKKEEVPRALSSPNSTYQTICPTTDTNVSNDVDSLLIPIKKRALNANDSDSEPAAKRTKIAKSLTIAGKNIDTNAENHAEITRAPAPKHNALPNFENDDHSVDESDDEVKDEPNRVSDDSNSSGLSSPPASPVMPPSPITNGISVPLLTNPGPKKGPSWHYEQAKETRLRDQRRKEWNRRRTFGASAKGEVPNRKMQRLLEEIEDTMGYAEAQGYEVGESLGGDGGLRRSARKGVRKNYAGQE